MKYLCQEKKIIIYVYEALEVLLKNNYYEVFMIREELFMHMKYLEYYGRTSMKYLCSTKNYLCK